MYQIDFIFNFWKYRPSYVVAAADIWILNYSSWNVINKISLLTNECVDFCISIGIGIYNRNIKLNLAIIHVHIIHDSLLI